MANQLKRKLEEIAANKIKEEVNMVQNEIKLLIEDKLDQIAKSESASSKENSSVRKKAPRKKSSKILN
jgi:hypothetical protein